MYKFVTSFRAIDQTSGEAKTYAGPDISALSWGLAEAWCRKYAPYLRVDGLLVAEIPCADGDNEDAAKSTVIDYTTDN